MPKKLINLLIEREPESKNIKRIKKIIPPASVLLLIIFVILHVASLIYVRTNINDYNNVNKQILSYQTRIASAKSSESVYITTIGILTKIKNIIGADTKIINNALPALINFQSGDVLIDNITIDNNGLVAFAVKTSSVDSLDAFVEELKRSEAEYNFGEVRASGILRDNDGSYAFTVNLSVSTKRQNAEG